MAKVAVREALIGRDVAEDPPPDEQMREVIAWYVGDPRLWGLIKEWMDDTGYAEWALSDKKAVAIASVTASVENEGNTEQ